MVLLSSKWIHRPAFYTFGNTPLQAQRQIDCATHMGHTEYVVDLLLGANIKR